MELYVTFMTDKNGERMEAETFQDICIASGRDAKVVETRCKALGYNFNPGTSLTLQQYVDMTSTQK